MPNSEAVDQIQLKPDIFRLLTGASTATVATLHGRRGYLNPYLPTDPDTSKRFAEWRDSNGD
ncbi:hypothetical protein [Planktotalea sp.]|uniref:hypothetical protein n=1 Tax=Planktotalea sp. TaxID=2029877 RepID=UPI0025FC9D33|nr:hypothetical protein [Planktotalea sp.]